MLPFIKEKISCWERIQAEKRPIFIYGMGNGALKIMSVFREYGVPIAGIFASDEFVRGHSFEGYKVHKLSEIEEVVDDFAVVLAFAAGYDTLVERIEQIAAKHTVYVPDVPVAGNGIFTYEYCIENADKLEKVYSILYDENSRQVFADIINFKISGDIKYLSRATSPKSDVYMNIIKPTQAEIYVDLGAYNGDTVRELLNYTNGIYRKIYAVEPDKKSYKKLVKSTENMENLITMNSVAWSVDTQIPFASKAGRQSAVSDDGDMLDAISVDNMLDDKKATIIKMDVEGSELQAIWGSCHTIVENAPKLMISLYHRNEDIFELPLLIHSLRPDYKLFIRHQRYIPAWETNLYAVL